MKKLWIIPVLLFVTACQPKPDKGPDNAARISILYDAFASGDVETVLAGFTSDIQWSEAENFIYDYGKPLVGGEAIVEGVFAKLGAEWEYWNLVDKKFQNVGEDGVLVTGRYQAKNKATGKVLDAQFAHVLKMRDTLVMSFQQYTDTLQAEEVVEMDDDDDEDDEMEESLN
jgi:ketosteroid isomerase-like protein